MIPEEHGHHHGHGTGVRWLDIIAGVSVVFISVMSLVVSIEHGKTMERLVEQNEKMVAGSTIPFLTFTGSELDAVTYEPATRLILKNGGVGPAVIGWFEIRYKGVAYGKLGPLLKACCKADLPKDDKSRRAIVYSNVSQTILPARESVDVIQMRPEAGRAASMALDRARQDLTARACYCSVLDECWITDFDTVRPQKVKDCAVPKNMAIW